MPRTITLPRLPRVIPGFGLAVVAAIAVGLWQPGPARAWHDDHTYEFKHRGCEYKYKEDKHGYKEEYICKNNDYGKSKYKYEVKERNCKYKYEESSKGYKEEYRCKRGRELQAGGGYWPKHQKRGPGVTKGAPFGIDLGSCNRKLIGAALGGATGGLIGAQIGDGSGQLAATAAGTLIGALLGHQVGRWMDEVDRACAGQAFEHAETNQTIRWNNPEEDTRYALTPQRSFNDTGGRYCREYQSTAVIGGKTQQTYGTACRQPDGSWKLES